MCCLKLPDGIYVLEPIDTCAFFPHLDDASNGPNPTCAVVTVGSGSAMLKKLKDGNR